jgi:hypothetical protein
METQWKIDRKTKNNELTIKKIQEKIPNEVSQMVVYEMLKNVGGSDWNNPLNVSKTIAEMMSIDLSIDVNTQYPRQCKKDLTVLSYNLKDKITPHWVCQNIIRVDEKYNNRYIDHNGSKYNKIDIIFESEYFKNYMDKVAKAARCKWNIRWGDSKNSENKLYRKTRPGASSENETWLDKCVKNLLTDHDTDGINIKNLIMIEFQRII